MMMGGLAVIWLIILIVFAVRWVGPLLATRDWPGMLPPGRARTPDELARGRYARGEIGWPEYQDLLLNLLKDRYVRGELELDEYEQRASLVLDGKLTGRDEASAQLLAPNTADGSQPRAPEAAAAPAPVAAEPARSAGAAAPTDISELPTTPEDTADSAQRSQVHTDSALDTLRRRFLSGELTPDEYEEQCRRLIAA